MQKTNAVRILERMGISFSTIEYEASAQNLDAVYAAEKINAEAERVFKTLAARGNDKNIYIFCIPGSFDLNLKSASKAAGVKKIELLPLNELLQVTGYVRGGCSPIGMKKNYPTFIDAAAQIFDSIYVSAGKRGLQLKIFPDDLLKAVNGRYTDLI